jgi:hypothetical protein
MSNRKKPGKTRRMQILKSVVEGREVSLDPDEKELIKVVPAVVGDVEIGETHIYDDGSVDVVISDDAPAEIVEEIRMLERELYAMDGEDTDGDT